MDSDRTEGCQPKKCSFIFGQWESIFKLDAETLLLNPAHL